MKYNYALAPTKRNPRCDKLGDEGVVSRHPQHSFPAHRKAFLPRQPPSPGKPDYRRSEIADANWQADGQLLVGLEVKMEIPDKLSLDEPGSKLEQASIIWLVTRGSSGGTK